MSKRKYREGTQIHSVAEFEQSDKDFYIIHFGNDAQTKHRAFLISWQYRLLATFIRNGRIFEAEKIGENNGNDHSESGIGNT